MSTIHHVCFFAELTDILAGDDAITKVFCSKGAAGTLPCLQCRNVVSTSVETLPPGFVSIACDDPTLFVRNNDEDY